MTTPDDPRRDTDRTTFTTILDALLERVSGAYAAAIVDSEGETVDYSGRGEPFDMRVAAAHLQLLVQDLARLEKLGEPRWLVIRGARKSIAATALAEGYALCILLEPRAAFSISTRAVKACVRALMAEAQWTLPEQSPEARKINMWFPVRVETDRRGRPVQVARTDDGGAESGIAGAKHAAVQVEVLGAVMGLPVRERGYRVRTLDGTELMLVRESGHRWYADEPV